MSGIHRHPACEKPWTDCGTPRQPIGGQLGGEHLTDAEDTRQLADTTDGVVLTKPVATTGYFIGEDILRITHVSFGEGVLTLTLTGYSERVRHNYLNIRINNDRGFQTPASFFGRYELGKGDMREVSFMAHENGRSVIITRSAYIQTIDGKNYPQKAKQAVYGYGAQTLTNFNTNNFEVALRSIGATTDRDSITDAESDWQCGRCAVSVKAEVGNRLGGTVGGL